MDFVDALRLAFLEDNKKGNPENKIDLLKKLNVHSTVKYHKTYMNDETFSVSKQYSKYINIPPTVRLSTSCCLVSTETRLTKKTIMYKIDMYVAEIAFVSNKIFKKNYEFMGTLFKTYNSKLIVVILENAVAKWPDRNDMLNIDIYPSFEINYDENSIDGIKKESINFGIKKVESTESTEKSTEKSIDELVDFIGIPKKVKKVKKKIVYTVDTEQVDLGQGDTFNYNEACEFLRKRYFEIII